MPIQSSRTSALPTMDDTPHQAPQDNEPVETDVEEQESDEPVSPGERDLVAWIDDQNIARHIPRSELNALGQLVVREYEIDETSRAEWKQDAKKALEFACQEAKPKQYPWPDASNIVYPLITSAAMEFAARAYPAMVPNRNVAKGVVWGSDSGTPATKDGKPDGAPLTDPETSMPVWKVKPGEKTKRAQIVGEHMSWQLLQQMEYWEPQTDAALHQISIVGGFVRKTYRDFREDCNASVLVDIMKIVWNKAAPSFEKAPRKTEIQEWYPFAIEEMQRDDQTFLDVPLGPGDNLAAGDDTDEPPTDPTDTEAPHIFLEQYRRYDLDGDGYPEPLIVTVHKNSGQVVRIIANYEEEGIETNADGTVKRIEPIECLTLYPFIPDPKGGSYPIGFGHLLKPLNEAVNTTLNQMFDAGHLQIAGGGFIGAGLSMHAGPAYFSIGEYKPVNNKGQDLRNNIFPMPWPGPSEVLFQLLGFLVSAAKEVASIKDVLTGDSDMANTPPTTMIALVEQGMKVYTAIHKRLYRALKSELTKLYRLNRIYLTEDERYRIGDTWREVTPDDYRLGGGVEPVSDPTMVTDMQRIARAVMVREESKNNPLVNPLEATRRVFEAAQIDRIDTLIPDQMPPPQPSAEDRKMLLDQASAQSKMGQERALELMQYTQAMLNLQKAKSEATGPQLDWLESQLNLMRLHIEALNTQVKAAAVDAKNRATTLGHHHDMASLKQEANNVANERPEPGPQDAGPASGGDSYLDEPPADGAPGNGVPGMAPLPNLSGLPALSGAPVPQPPGPGG